MSALVKDVMAKPVVTIDIDKNAYTAGELMRKTRRYTLVVLKKGKPVGILTDSDLIKKVVAKNIKPSSVPIKDIMSSPIVTATPSETIVDITKKMKRSNIKRLPVLDNEKLVGIISLSDVALASPELINLLEYKLIMKESPPGIKERFTSGICESCGNYSPDLQNKDGDWVCEDCREEVEE